MLSRSKKNRNERVRGQNSHKEKERKVWRYQLGAPWEVPTTRIILLHSANSVGTISGMHRYGLIKSLLISAVPEAEFQIVQFILLKQIDF